ncbi:MAG: hypothetical protein LH472_09580 [Pyrinomonadaceae bacterium]|nr:hypothetical protein [Pyrinomonadaceae bacterium]
MRFSILLFLTILFVGCGGAETVSNTTNTTVKNTNTATPNANNPLGTTKPPEAATANNAPTIAPVVAAYYEALKKKDDAALRKIYSRATLKSLEADMKEEKQTSLAKFITDLEPAPDKPFEVRNETVAGDVIVAEVRGGSYPNGIRIKFVKENGEWKMTQESPDVKTADKPVSNSAK